MSVAQLYHHLAPKTEVHNIAKALIRLLRSHREVQSVVLNSIASISIDRKVCVLVNVYNFLSINLNEIIF